MGIRVDGAKLGTVVAFEGLTVGMYVVGTRVGIIVGLPASTVGDMDGCAVTKMTSFVFVPVVSFTLSTFVPASVVS